MCSTQPTWLDQMSASPSTATAPTTTIPPHRLSHLQASQMITCSRVTSSPQKKYVLFYMWVEGPYAPKILALPERGGELCPLPGFFGVFVHNALRALQRDHSSPRSDNFPPKVCPMDPQPTPTRANNKHECMTIMTRHAALTNHPPL